MCRHDRQLAYRGPAEPEQVNQITADPSLRVGDHEREQVSAELRAHFTNGRLGMDDFSARLEEAWAATTLAELSAALRNLPPLPGLPRPWDQPGAVPGRYAQGGSGYLFQRGDRPSLATQGAHAHRRTFVAVMALLVGVWALTGFGYFWPAWPLLFWGFFVFRHQRWARRHDRRRWVQP